MFSVDGWNMDPVLVARKSISRRAFFFTYLSGFPNMTQKLFPMLTYTFGAGGKPKRQFQINIFTTITI